MKKKALTVQEMAQSGGLARAAALTKARMQEIASSGGKARWKGHIKKSGK